MVKSREQVLVEAALPVRVSRVEVDDPVATIAGDGWFLGILCPWTITGPGIAFDTESESGPMVEAIQVLVGQVLDHVAFGADPLLDPTFHFASGYELSIRADSDLDPWVFSISGVVLVGRGPDSGPEP